MDLAVVLSVVTILLSLFGSVITAAVLVGTVKAELKNNTEAVDAVAKQMENHIQFHLLHQNRSGDK